MCYFVEIFRPVLLLLQHHPPPSHSSAFLGDNIHKTEVKEGLMASPKEKIIKIKGAWREGGTKTGSTVRSPRENSLQRHIFCVTGHYNLQKCPVQPKMIILDENNSFYGKIWLKFEFRPIFCRLVVVNSTFSIRFVFLC